MEFKEKSKELLRGIAVGVVLGIGGMAIKAEADNNTPPVAEFPTKNYTIDEYQLGNFTCFVAFHPQGRSYNNDTAMAMDCK